MDRLIRDILTYSRVTRRDVYLHPVSLDKLVRELLDQYPELSSHRADISIQGKLPDVRGHEPSLSQVISNLLNNAVKFVPSGVKPQVVIRSEVDHERVRLFVEDNGIGIKPQNQDRLFRMFERVHAGDKYEGTGIGLAIVRKAIERMGGKVGVESDGVRGSKFWIELPVAQ
jgi:signal transduction histidine kinase